MRKTHASFVARTGTLIVGAISSFAVATLLLNNFGQGGYAKYVLLTSLPSLIPFADYGIGANIFNYSADKSKGQNPTNNVSETFIISVILSLLSIAAILIITNIPYTRSLFLQITNSSNLVAGTAILAITFFAVPFSLSARKLFAEEKVLTVFMIQGSIPVFIVTLVFLSTANNSDLNQHLYFIPSCAYLMSTVILFIKSNIISDFRRPSTKKFGAYFRSILTLSFWSLSVTTVTALVWQVPKYILQFAGTVDEVTRYSLMALFVIPGLSLTAVSATWHSTNVRRNSLKVDLLTGTSAAIKSSQAISIIFSSIAFIGFVILNIVGFRTPDFKSQFLAFAILILSPIWMIPMSCFTESSDLKWISLRMLPCFLISSLIFALIAPWSYEISILTYALCLSLSVAYFASSRVKTLKQF